MAALSNELQIAVEHHQAGRLAEADSLYRRVLEFEPNNASALHLRGVLAHQQARNEDAVGSIEKAIRAGGPHPVVLNDLGKAYFALKRYREAKRCFAKALSLDPDHAEALGNIGAVLALTGELREARSRLRMAVALQPGYPNAWFNLGAVLRRLHEPEEAEQSCRRALALNPRMADAHLELGNVLADLGKLEQAEACYRKAIELDSTLAPAHARLAETLKMTLRLEEAEASYRAALALQPSAATFQALGGVLYELDRPLEAREAFRRALEVDPELVEARWSLAVLRVIELDDAGRTEDAAAELERLSAWLDSHRIDDPSRAVGAMYPFDLAYRERNHRPLLERYGGLCAGLMERWRKKERLRPARPAGMQPIRVGVVSAHVHEHSVWNAIVKGWVGHMDRGRFELSLFHLGIRQDAETDYARSRAAHFEAGARPLRRWVDAISERRPDVLIYPEIGMDLTSARLACLRLAPLQLAAWGHPLTTGLPTVDAYLSAELFEPPEAGEHYRERLIALPNLGCCYEPYRVEALDPDPAEPGIEPGAPLLLCPGAPFKYASEHDDVYPAIARALGACRLVFFELNPRGAREALIARLKAAFARAGLDYERYVSFVPPLVRPAFYGLMKRADVFLDTIGFSGFNTAMQAVECGLPIVAWEGRFMRGRFASGIVKRMKLDEVVAKSEKEYIALAAKLAGDTAYREQIRARIVAARGVLYEDKAPIRALEEFMMSEIRRA